MVLLTFAVCGNFRRDPNKKRRRENVTPLEDRPASDSRSFMELFTKLERDLVLAAQKKDRTSLDGLVAAGFTERTAIDPEHPVARAEWIEKALPDYRLDPMGVRSMVIRAFMGNALVSFVQKQAPSAVDSRDYFIVDLWVVNQGKWQLASRFVSPVGPHDR